MAKYTFVDQLKSGDMYYTERTPGDDMLTIPAFYTILCVRQTSLAKVEITYLESWGQGEVHFFNTEFALGTEFLYDFK